MSNKHIEAVEWLQKLNDYCNDGNCKSCVFHCLGDCPFYIIDKDDFEKLRNEAETLGSEE